MAGFIGQLQNLLGSGANWLTSGFNLAPGATASTTPTGLGGLLSGLTGSTSPLADIMALLSFINQGQVTQEQMGYLKDILNQRSSALGTAMNPNALAAWRTAVTPQGMSTGNFASTIGQLTPAAWTPQQYGNIASQLTSGLTPQLTYSTLNPVNAELAARGQNESPATAQYVSQQALAPYVLQEQQMGQAGAGQLMSQEEAYRQMGLTGAQDILNQLLTEQNLGQNLTQFGLSLPGSTAVEAPTFGYQAPANYSDLATLLGTAAPTFTAGSISPTNVTSNLQLLP